MHLAQMCIPCSSFTNFRQQQRSNYLYHFFLLDQLINFFNCFNKQNYCYYLVSPCTYVTIKLLLKCFTYLAAFYTFCSIYIYKLHHRVTLLFSRYTRQKITLQEKLVCTSNSIEPLLSQLFSTFETKLYKECNNYCNNRVKKLMCHMKIKIFCNIHRDGIFTRDLLLHFFLRH